MTAAAVSVLSWSIARRRGMVRPELVALAVFGFVVAPFGVLVLGISWLAAIRWTAASRETKSRRDAEDSVVMLADLVVLALEAGASTRRALESARPFVHPRLAAELDLLLGEMDRSGSARALATADGRLAGLAKVLAGAAGSGAPIAAAVAGFADRERHRRHAAKVEAARRLPVRLLLPLALLILPGFVVLAVGPAVLQALARLDPIP